MKVARSRLVRKAAGSPCRGASLRRIMLRSVIHPGEHLAEDLEELGISAAKLARQFSVPTNRVTEIQIGRRSIPGNTALRFGHFSGISPDFWISLQKTL